MDYRVRRPVNSVRRRAETSARRDPLIRSGSIGILVASVLLSAWGCTGGGSTPAAPAPAPPTTDSLAITSGVDALRTGFFADYSLIATMSDRTTQTAFSLFELNAERYAYFVQSLEDRFYHADEAERIGASLTMDLPVDFIT